MRSILSACLATCLLAVPASAEDLTRTPSPTPSVSNLPDPATGTVPEAPEPRPTPQVPPPPAFRPPAPQTTGADAPKVYQTPTQQSFQPLDPQGLQAPPSMGTPPQAQQGYQQPSPQRTTPAYQPAMAGDPGAQPLADPQPTRPYYQPSGQDRQPPAYQSPAPVPRQVPLPPQAVEVPAAAPAAAAYVDPYACREPKIKVGMTYGVAKRMALREGYRAPFPTGLRMTFDKVQSTCGGDLGMCTRFAEIDQCDYGKCRLVLKDDDDDRLVIYTVGGTVTASSKVMEAYADCASPNVNLGRRTVSASATPARSAVQEASLDGDSPGFAVRSGTECGDGVTSGSTGRGACSRHGGVAGRARASGGGGSRRR